MTEIFSHFFQPCFGQICLLPKQSQVQTTTDAFASGVGGGVTECRQDDGVEGEGYEGCLTSALRALHCSCVAVACVLRVLMRAQQRFNLSYENICTRLAATDVIELKSG